MQPWRRWIRRMLATTSALGKQWEVHLTVQGVTPEERQIDLLTQLPFGIRVHNHIKCTPLDSQHTRVSFG
jgi:hypothetical protein